MHVTLFPAYLIGQMAGWMEGTVAREGVLYCMCKLEDALRDL